MAKTLTEGLEMWKVDTFSGEASVGEAHDSQASWLQHPVHLLENLLNHKCPSLWFL